MLGELWISRKCYVVEHGVIAEIRRLTAQVDSLTRSLAFREQSNPRPPMAPANDRWNTGRKQALLNAIAAGIMTDSDAAYLYGVTSEELEAWREGRMHLKAVAERAR